MPAKIDDGSLRERGLCRRTRPCRHGQVPPEDIKRLLGERPKAKVLTVAGMPAGSPGMEGAGSEPYASLLFQADGSYVEYAMHG
ncbi:MAG: hypothetical protein HC855_16475 [Rhizobiales bacterium]|nr:hypothetical protein [Hyphomicrobiales bacterium]